MNRTFQAPDLNRDLIRWMSQLETHIAAQRSGLAGVVGRPRVDKLIQLQKMGQIFLGKLVNVFWSQNETSRAVLLQAYLSALITLKLYCDDVYVEALEEAQPPKNKGDAPSPSTITKIEESYQKTIEVWIIGSPLINPTTHKNNASVIPKISNYINIPFLRPLSFGRELNRTPRTTAAEMVKEEVQRISRNPKAAAQLSASADHLLGVVFLLTQIELKLRWENDQTKRSDVDGWYEAALHPVNVMANEIFGIFDDMLRDAILSGRSEETERLSTARHVHIKNMATRYSLRRQETSVLLSFFDKQRSTGNFASQDVAVGVNRIQEILFAYVGRSNPDDQSNREALSVATVRRREAELSGSGKSVKIFGTMNTSGTKLTDQLTKASINIYAERNPLARPALSIDRRGIIEGSITGNGASLAVNATSISPHSEGYRALVGFPLRFAQTDQSGNLELLPQWRRLTPALQRAAVREFQEDEEGVFSVPETLARQREFITDLLRHSEIHKAFATSLKRTKSLNLQDTEVRVKIWSVLLKELVKNGNRGAIRVLCGYLHSYFSLFTKHTYFNLRDSGKPYVDSPWPTDLTNRKLQDCGVYAVQAAYDLFRAVAGTSNLTLEFRFLTFLNHICLIVFFDNAAFLVNNATVYQPEDIRQQGTPTEDQKIEAAFNWGGRAFTTVYDVSYTMFLSVLPKLSVTTNRSDAAFKEAIWKTFQNSQGWGISNDATIAEEYFKAISLFNEKSIDLAKRVDGLKSGKEASADDWKNATTLALDLYKLGEAMSEYKNFVFFNENFIKNNPIPAVGYFAKKEKPTDKSATLPMYELADLLLQRKKRGQSLTVDQETLSQKPTGRSHVNKLTERFGQEVANP